MPSSHRLYRASVMAFALVVLVVRPCIAHVQPVARGVEASVRDVLQQYSTALESLDADAVKKVQPSIDLDSLKKAFREMRALDVDIDTIKVLSSDASAVRVSCRVTQTLTPKAGSKRTTAVTRVLRLRQKESVWVIDSFER